MNAMDSQILARQAKQQTAGSRCGHCGRLRQFVSDGYRHYCQARREFVFEPLAIRFISNPHVPFQSQSQAMEPVPA